MLQKIKFRKLSLQGNPRICYPLPIFNNSEDFQSTSQKHIGLIPDNRLSFKEYLTVMEVQESKTIALLCKLQNISLKHTLITIYKTFVCPYLHYRDILFDKLPSALFHQKIESIQYNENNLICCIY